MTSRAFQNACRLDTDRALSGYGAVPGVDCSAIVANILGEGLPLIIPAVQSGVPWVMGDIAVPSGAVIVGQSGQNYSTNINKMRVQAKPGSAAVFSCAGAKNVHMSGFCIDGNGTGANGIVGDATQGYLSIEGIEFRALANGVGSAAYIHTVKIKGCTFFGNVNGFTGLIDSIVEGNFFSANTSAGGYLGNGANANIISGNKFEWNQQYGLHLQDCSDITITGGVFDRNYFQGVVLDNTSGYVIINGVLFKRNGRDNTGVNLSHVRAIGTVGHIVINGCGTKTGQDDGGTGTFTPQYSIDIGAATVDSITIDGNDLTGCMTAGGGLHLGANATNVNAHGNLGAMDIDVFLTVVTAAGTTVLDGTYSKIITTGGTTQSLTLPAARPGRRAYGINRSTGTVTYNRTGADTINGAAGGLAVATGQMFDLTCNGADWEGKAW